MKKPFKVLSEKYESVLGESSYASKIRENIFDLQDKFGDSLEFFEEWLTRTTGVDYYEGEESVLGAAFTDHAQNYEDGINDRPSMRNQYEDQQEVEDASIRMARERMEILHNAFLKDIDSIEYKKWKEHQRMQRKVQRASKEVDVNLDI